MSRGRTRKKKKRFRSESPRRSGSARARPRSAKRPVKVTSSPMLFDKALSERRYGDACDLLIECLEKLRLGGGIEVADEEILAQGYTWWASAITRLLSEPSLDLSDAVFARLATLHPALTDIFGCSDFGNCDQLLGAATARLESAGNTDRAALARLLLSYSVYSNANFDFGQFLRTTPDLAARAYFGIMSSHLVLTREAFATRRKLLELGPELEQVQIPLDELDGVAWTWFLSSYDDQPGKHDIKRHLNRIFRASLSEVGVRDLVRSASRPTKARPTVVVAIEQFESRHAMYRCYAPSIRQLKDHFDLVLLCDPSAVDDRSRALFDRVVQLHFTPSGLRQAIADLEKLAPDIVYYPSVGMSARIIALANLRLAPIQILTLGHPATTNADTIDYVVTEERYLGDPELFSETVLCVADGSCQFEKRHDMRSVTPIIREHADPIRISVPSAPFKLNPTFMATCQEIAQRSERRVEFCFFPYRRGLKLHHIQKRIRGWLPEATVFRTSDYNTYVTDLNSCDLQLISFPFGGTNSSMDALRQGIPVVTLEGDEVHSRTDAVFIRHIGSPDWLIADSHEAYVEAALRLIHDDRERVATSRQILEADLDGQYHDCRYETQPKDFGALFKWLYENHEAVQADGRKVWRRADRAEAVQ